MSPFVLPGGCGHRSAAAEEGMHRSGGSYPAFLHIRISEKEDLCQRKPSSCPIISTIPCLLWFVLPCIGTMLFTSIYGIVDGLCVSNFVGKTAFAAINLIMPLPQMLGTVGFMLGTGGSAIVGITLGEGDQKKADRYFSMFMWAALVSAGVLAVLGIVFLRPVAVLLGAKGELLDYAVRYGRILMLALPGFALQNLFQSFFVTAEKPHLGFWFTVGAGCTNMVLDVVMVGMLHWGVEGAALATLISQLVGGVLPVFYFIDHNNTSCLHLCRTQFYGGVLWDACINGSSELMTSLSMSLVNILYNFQLLRLVGENGVAAYGVIMYAAFLFVAVFVGYAVVSTPDIPLFLHRVTIRPAGPTANTVPTMISSTTENTRMMFCITGPR